MESEAENGSLGAQFGGSPVEERVALVVSGDVEWREYRN